MRQEGAVAETHEPVDDGGRVDDDLDEGVWDVEQPVRLDQLQALVGERGGVDGDLRAHVPGRMRQRVRRRHLGKVASHTAAERASGGRQDEAGDGCRVAALEALMECRMLAVDGEQQPSAPASGGDRELACGDKALLVRERERHAVLERPERRANAREADDRVEDDVRRRPLEELDRVTADLHVLDAVLRGERVQRRRAGLQRAQLEVGVRGDDLDGLTTDRAGCSEQGDALHRPKDA